MGRAIVRQPQVFLMDEPLSNLDAKLRVQTRTELVELQKRLAVTNGLRHPRSGRGDDDGATGSPYFGRGLQQCDKPSTLYHAPANLFVAGFIGSPAMNTLPVARTGPVEIAGVRIGVDDDLGGERTVIGFRPEAVLSQRLDPGAHPRCRGPRIRSVRPRPHRSFGRRTTPGCSR